MRDTCRIDLATTPPFRIGALCVEPALRQASTAVTEPETLEPRVMLVLVALARTRGTIVSRDQLIEQCWNSRIVGDNSINRVISRLRKLATAHGEALFSASRRSARSGIGWLDRTRTIPPSPKHRSGP